MNKMSTFDIVFNKAVTVLEISLVGVTIFGSLGVLAAVPVYLLGGTVLAWAVGALTISVVGVVAVLLAHFSARGNGKVTDDDLYGGLIGALALGLGAMLALAHFTGMFG